ncbi:bis(5'-nucleosyl)-tetraphosphatase (symmetrical) YqeK [Paenibacillus lautus]|jgi:predicted HD superfamily hydrolase involved in NAD metabolism|uniref:bis(5'-nucleosyl)-tetraphosphatase (symmetrical) n=2 Tax=Paenibacillus lautus TaxID=1401 RepID=A0A385THN7_PAELA|nr:bis(5'-nucleosyl)-tetraphosphatase (symmetrical) YqeK [Paenibacillus lautus]AYB43143.1 HD domain-containing protein [Paenibacillus lautus]MCI1774316.1 bis(5'-nucleosyl)-tetraphosphatase (symmetrical) YqeK [Paenibacillus lautus]
MKSVYNNLVINTLSGNLKDDIYNFLVSNGCPKTAEHCVRVGEEARKIAERYHVDKDSAEIAGYLHDISAVYSNDIRIQVSHDLGIEVLPEEETFPMIIHQKISKEMARDLFHINDQEILDAVGCHTTLKKGSTLLDKVLFVADKIEWDQNGEPPYLDQITQQLEHSLNHASFEYINFLWKQRENLRVIHPWLRDAYYELKDLVEFDVIQER